MTVSSNSLYPPGFASPAEKRGEQVRSLSYIHSAPRRRKAKTKYITDTAVLPFFERIRYIYISLKQCEPVFGRAF